MDITGNKATAYGFIAAAEKAGLKLYLGSYPITPATDVLHELSKHKSLGVTTVQCEDEIAGCASALGASFAGALGVTSTSGPGTYFIERKLYPNVDFYSGFIYNMLGIPEELYTPLFAMARVVGWSAHRIEELVNSGKIIRPAYQSVMSERQYLPLEKRE